MAPKAMKAMKVGQEADRRTAKELANSAAKAPSAASDGYPPHAWAYYLSIFHNIYIYTTIYPIWFYPYHLDERGGDGTLSFSLI